MQPACVIVLIIGEIVIALGVLWARIERGRDRRAFVLTVDAMARRNVRMK